MAVFKIPSQLRNFTNNEPLVNVPGKDVLEAVKNLIHKHQDLKDQIFSEKQKVK